MGVNGDNGNYESMDFQTAQSKRRRFNTGTDNAAFSALSMDDKLSHMFDKLNDLEQTNKAVVNIAYSMNQTCSQINHMSARMNGHEQLLKLIAYKSIDSEARSRRRNLIFHGLAEMKYEDCSAKLGDFLWNEMGIDIDDLYTERIHRLGSLQRARQLVTDSNQPLRRPIIEAFNDTRSVNKVLDNAYTLRGSGFSVTRDFPQEIVSARRKLKPQYIQEKQNRQNKVSIEYPAKLVVNGKIISDAFPDWHAILNQDRYEMAKSLSQAVNMDMMANNGQQPHPPTIQPPPMNIAPRPPPQPPQAPPIRPPPQAMGVRSQFVPGSSSNTGVTPNTPSIQAMVPGYRTYSQVVSTAVQQAPYIGAPINSTAGNVPRYTGLAPGNQSNTQRAQAETTLSSASGRGGSVNSTRLTDNAVNGNANNVNAKRDQPSYQHL